VPRRAAVHRLPQKQQARVWVAIFGGGHECSAVLPREVRGQVRGSRRCCRRWCRAAAGEGRCQLKRGRSYQPHHLATMGVRGVPLTGRDLAGPGVDGVEVEQSRTVHPRPFDSLPPVLPLDPRLNLSGGKASLGGQL